MEYNKSSSFDELSMVIKRCEFYERAAANLANQNIKLREISQLLANGLDDLCKTADMTDAQFDKYESLVKTVNKSL